MRGIRRSQMYTAKLLFVALTYVAVCYGSAISRTATRCPGARVLKTEMIGKVNFTTFECPDHVPADLKAASTGLQQVSTSPNVPRQFQNCAGGAADAQCQCAELCNLPFCTGSRAVAPLQSDCQAIANEFSTVPGSFFVASGNGVSATVGSCEAVWINESTGQLEYCFENFGSLATVTFTNCVIVDGGGQGGCIADNFLWFFEFLIPGNTILIP
ncbi:unnamed protein product [Somion occarium]|uniref:Uncharacterized protein n=1 Tax=Somion occarium TaxID=3059160 RepID=A0ABP1DTZ6_9APHY